MKKFLLSVFAIISCALCFCACSSDMCKHDVVIIPGVQATCEEDGLSDGLYCNKCKKYVKKQEVIKAYGHNFKLEEVLAENKDNIARTGRFDCTRCDEVKYDTISSKDISLPIINITGSLDGISKENKIQASISYESENLTFSSDATFKLQGASSVRNNYPKQNFSIQLFEEGSSYLNKNKIELKDGWGKQSKYVLKANYVDFSGSRNIVAANIYGAISESRNLDDEYSGLVNGGAVDGFPVLLYYNNEYHGLYTLNIPKDKWLFDMKDQTIKQAILMADGYTNSTKFQEHVSDDFVSTKWDLEYCSTEDDEGVGTAWVVESFNNLIDFVLNNDGTAFKTGISEFLDVDRTIDTMILTLYVLGSDNYQNNIIYSTYDGKKWTCTPYDLDATFGLQYDGKLEYTYNDKEGYGHDKMTSKILTTNLLWKKIYENFQDEIVLRWVELRANVLSEQNVLKIIGDFSNQIPEMMFGTESHRWTNIPSQDRNNKYQIEKFAILRLEYIDDYFSNLKSEEGKE